jgi:hypothetical protein
VPCRKISASIAIFTRLTLRIIMSCFSTEILADCSRRLRAVSPPTASPMRKYLTRRPRAPGRSPLFPQPISSAGPRLPIGLRTAEGGRSLLVSLLVCRRCQHCSRRAPVYDVRRRRRQGTGVLRRWSYHCVLGARRPTQPAPLLPARARKAGKKSRRRLNQTLKIRIWKLDPRRP